MAHARYTWIIPVSGRPAIDTDGRAQEAAKLSEGLFYNPSEAFQLPPSGTIAWNSQELLIFWLWLRDTRNQSIFGKTSISFTHRKIDKMKTYYISLYHDSEFSMIMRTYIGSFEPSKMEGVLSTESRGILMAKKLDKCSRTRHVLKGARLLLVDELGKGLLVA